MCSRSLDLSRNFLLHSEHAYFWIGRFEIRWTRRRCTRYALRFWNCLLHKAQNVMPSARCSFWTSRLVSMMSLLSPTASIGTSLPSTVMESLDDFTLANSSLGWVRGRPSFLKRLLPSLEQMWLSSCLRLLKPSPQLEQVCAYWRRWTNLMWLRRLYLSLNAFSQLEHFQLRSAEKHRQHNRDKPQVISITDQVSEWNVFYFAVWPMKLIEMTKIAPFLNIFGLMDESGL